MRRPGALTEAEDEMEVVLRSYLSGERDWRRFISRVEVCAGGIPLALKVLAERGPRICEETVLTTLRWNLQSRMRGAV